MTIEEQLKTVILEKYKSVRAFVQEVGIPYTTLDSALKRGLLNAGIGTMTKVFNALDLDVESIQTDTLKSKKNTFNSFELTSAELSHVKKYRTLDEHGKKIVELVLDTESERMKNISHVLTPSERIIILDDYITPVSAGTGEFALDDSPKEQIKVIDNAYTRKANFIVRVKGDSMIPRYFDGDKLLIQSAGIPNFGEIGIWYVNGQTYVKQAGNGELLSLNSNYAPIPLNGKEYQCEGKVIGVLDPAWIVE